jgi:hypothetical protein
MLYWAHGVQIMNCKLLKEISAECALPRSGRLIPAEPWAEATDQITSDDYDVLLTEKK